MHLQRFMNLLKSFGINSDAQSEEKKEEKEEKKEEKREGKAERIRELVAWQIACKMG